MSTTEGKMKLDVDWDALFPKKEVKILACSINIKPLGLEQLSIVSGMLKSIGQKLSKAGVTWDNYNTPSGLIPLFHVCLSECPEVLSEVTGININDLKRLPLAENIALLACAIEVNMASKESMEKNFKGLVKSLGSLTETSTE